MKRRLILRPSARQDIVEGDKWYEKQNKGLGDRFLLEVQRCLGFIIANPGGFQRVHEQFRQAPLKVIPYVIVYRLDGDVIVVMRVFHTSQHPRRRFRKRK